jgi:AraC family transcriptional regulator of adaptative response / DNA-3-methyladenine glycosylase II
MFIAVPPPFDAAGVLRFLRVRAAPGVEIVGDGIWRRTARIDGRPAIVTVRTRPDGLDVDAADATVIAGIARLFGTDQDVAGAEACLSADPRLGPLVGRRPGLRVPGGFDQLETAVRVVLGQQVSIKAASTLAGRLAARFGEPIPGLDPELSHLTPTADRLAAAATADLTALGILASRADTLRGIAAAFVEGTVRFGPDPEETLASLRRISGVGDWTAQVIAMRTIPWEDAFPAGDLVIARLLGTERRARAAADAWRPYRAWATQHLWAEAANGGGA